MRIFKDFKDMLGEVKRDLAEMGVEIHTQTYQDKFIGDKPEFATLELQNYHYIVTQPNEADLNPVQPWADLEWEERRQGAEGNPINPGTAWETRREIWTEFLEANGRFAYTYPERLSRQNQVRRVIKRLREDPVSRQMFISIWSVEDTLNFGTHRVPCSLGYQVQIRHGKLDLTYLMRSCDFVTHFQNDVWLAHQLQKYLAEKVGVPVGNLGHWMASLHIYKKDVEGVF